MRPHLLLLAALAPAALPCSAPADPAWIFRPSSYTHDPHTGQRVTQYAPKQPAYARVDPTYQQSGYRHDQAILRGADGSADRVHIVETWGAGEAIRPYGEWEYPFRAGATPFGPWGNPAGPWTSPYGSWVNPYGLGRLPIPPWLHSYFNFAPGAPPATPSDSSGGAN
jgi:hypothetical protein